jgi:hypothetical protein
VDEEPKRIARGNFGCIYAPAPACIGGSRKTYSPSAVGKISAEDELYETEARVLQRLEEIDPEHRFHVRYYGNCLTKDRPDCPLDEDEESDGSEEGEEKRAPIPPPPRGLLVMERGTPLSREWLASLTAEQLDAVFAHLWEGLVKMARAGICYEDLHAGNLLVVGAPSGAKELVGAPSGAKELGDDGGVRLVDFGGCTLDVDPATAARTNAKEMRILLEDLGAGLGEAGEAVTRRWLEKLKT